MKKKSVIIIVIFIIVLLVVGSLLFFKYGKEEEKETSNNITNETEQTEPKGESIISDDEFEEMEAVDNELNRLVTSSEFMKLSDDKRAKECEKLLQNLKDNGKIKNFSFSSSEMIYYFEYKNGVLGGIKIKDWDPEMN